MDIEELLDLQDKKFIDATYAALLGRPPDAEGRDHYLKRLRRGVAKMKIIAEIRESKEGSKRTTCLLGVDTAIKRYKIRTLPVVGNIWVFFENLYTDPVKDRTLRIIENRVSSIQEKVQKNAQVVVDNFAKIVEVRIVDAPVANVLIIPLVSKRPRLGAKVRLAVLHGAAQPKVISRTAAITEIMFDLDWYKNIRPACAGKADAVRMHNTHKNDVDTKFSLSPYFCPKFYRLTNPEVDFEVLSPYEHFLQIGCVEERDPCPLFMSSWYRKTYRISENTVPFLHYIREGWLEGNSPHPLFDRKHYLDQLDSVWGDPFYHYLTEGWRNGLSPNPVFDPGWYSLQIGAFDTSPLDLLSDYLLRRPSEEISPHQLFSAPFYKDALAAAGEVLAPNQALLLHYILHDAKVDPHPLFDAVYYAKQAKLDSVSSALSHFLVAEAPFHDPHPFFSSKYYLTRRPDVAEIGINPLLHYLQSGFAEASYPHPLFDNEFYRVSYLDVAKSSTPPLLHYLTIGKAQGFECRRNVEPIRTAMRSTGGRLIQIEKDALNINGSDDVINLRKGVFAHVFYPDLLEEIIIASNNVPAPCTVFITTDSLSKSKYIIEAGAKISSHPIEVRVVENRGRDIAPMIVDFKDRLREIELGVHIHTKKSKHYVEEFKSWRRYLIQSNLGSKEIVLNILRIFNHPGIGMVAPADYGPVASLVQWGGNLPNVSSLVRMMTENKVVVSSESILEMPTGSMFWFRSEAITPLLDLNLNSPHFDPELGQVDGTLAHAIERSFFFVCEIAGLQWVRFTVVKKAKLLAQSPISFFQRIVPIASGASVLVDSFPETRKYTPAFSPVEKARLNLLIPSAELSKGYAGVSEALRIFNALKQKLSHLLDFRIISSDVPIAENSNSVGETMIVAMCDDGIDFNDVVVDGTKRAFLPLAVRRHDIFVATAWWTATACREIRTWQLTEFKFVPEKFLYLIQDYESGFYPWSTRYMLAEATYENSVDILPIFNTQILADFFFSSGYFTRGVTYQPPMNEKIAAALDFSATREKIVLLYVRPHALRNCLEFSDALIEHLIENDPAFWSDWSFVAIGEDFNAADYLKCGRIRVHGRLSLTEYADYLSRARLGISLMVSPHPSYPPLEMAAAGLLVLTNKYANKDLSTLHDNIRSFATFDLNVVSGQMRALAEESLTTVAGQSKVDWFFDGKSNLGEVVDVVARELEGYVDN